MKEKNEFPALARPLQMLVAAGVFSSYRDAEYEIRQGNVYVEINPDDPSRSYFVRLDDTETLMLVTGQTRVKVIDDDGQIHYFVIRPYEGNKRG